MFALIKTNNATHIAIHIPKESAAQSLPTLANMLEQNAVFLNQSWSSTAITKATMTIHLGDVWETENSGEEVIVVPPNNYIIREEFELATPEVFTSNRKAIAAKDEEIRKLRAELAHTKDLLDSSRNELARLKEEE